MEALAKYLAGPLALVSLGLAIRDSAMWIAIVVWVLAGMWGLASIIAWRREVRVEFELTPSAEPIAGSLEIGDGRTFGVLTALWIAVRNHGAPATFSAQISNATSVKRLEDGAALAPAAVDEVAWEHSHERSYLIGWRKRARLKVGYVSRDPKCFWFWTAQSATWSPVGHGWGWRLVPTASTVEFDLEVLNETYRRFELRHCQLVFAPDGSVSSFGFA